MPLKSSVTFFHQRIHPEQFTWNPKHGDLEDDLFAFSIGCFLCSMLIFRGVQRLPACITINTRLNQQLRCRHCSYWTCSKAMFIDAFPQKINMSPEKGPFQKGMSSEPTIHVPRPCEIFRKSDFHRNVGFRECRRLAVEFPNKNIHDWINTKFWVVQKFYWFTQS